MDALNIKKDLEWEDQLKDNITYIPLAGASEVENFRSPDSFVFIFFRQSTGYHTIDFVEYMEKNHQLHISFPGQIHSWKTISATGHKLIVSKRFIEINLIETCFSLQHINDTPVINLTVEQSDKLDNEFILLSEGIADETISQQIVSLRAQLIIHLIAHYMEYRGSRRGNRRSLPTVITRFTDLIEEHFLNSKAVRFYADLLAVSPNYLNTLVKKETGLSAKQIIDARMVLEAKRRLLGTGQPIKEIATDLGFDSTPTFYAYMHRKTGFYPKKFREPAD